MELEILKAYIKNNLANRFIKPFKSPAEAPIFFNKKPDRNLRLYINYRGLNDWIIKNQYPVSLVEKSLDRLGWAQHFTKLDLINAYHWMRIREENELKMAFRIRYGYFKY